MVIYQRDNKMFYFLFCRQGTEEQASILASIIKPLSSRTRCCLCDCLNAAWFSFLCAPRCFYYVCLLLSSVLLPHLSTLLALSARKSQHYWFLWCQQPTVTQNLKTLCHRDAQVYIPLRSWSACCLAWLEKLYSFPLADCKGSEHKSPAVNLSHALCSPFPV